MQHLKVTIDASDAIRELKELRDQSEIPLFMTLEDVERLSKFSLNTIRKAIQEERLKASQPEGREYRVARSDFLSWMSDSPFKERVAPSRFDPFLPYEFFEPEKPFILSDHPEGYDPLSGKSPILFFQIISFGGEFGREFDKPAQWKKITLPFAQPVGPVEGTILEVDEKRVLVRVVHPHSLPVENLLHRHIQNQILKIRLRRGVFGGFPYFQNPLPQDV